MPSTYYLPLLLIIKLLKNVHLEHFFWVYGMHSKNTGSGLNCSQLAEPSRSVTTPARASNRGLCLSCCSLAYGVVQTIALPALLAACSPTSQDRGRESSHCCRHKKQRKAGLKSSLVVRPQPCRKRERDRGTCMNKVGRTERNEGKKESEGVSRSSLHSTVTSRLSGCPQQPDMMS